MLGAVGVNLGTRFLASKEATIEGEWKQAIVAANSEDAVKIDFFNEIRPLPGTGGYGTVLRSLRTPFVDQWRGRREEVAHVRERLSAELTESARAGRRHDTILPSGQTAGGIKEIMAIPDIMRRLVTETEAALARAPRLS